MAETSDQLDADLREQKRFLSEAGAAAADGDYPEMLTRLVKSKIFDGLARRLESVDHYARGRAHPDDINLAIGRATDALYRTQSANGGVNDVGAFLYKAARNILTDMARIRQRDGEPLPDDGIEDHHPGALDELVEHEQGAVDYDRKRIAAFRLVRTLLRTCASFASCYAIVRTSPHAVNEPAEHRVRRADALCVTAEYSGRILPGSLSLGRDARDGFAPFRPLTRET